MGNDCTKSAIWAAYIMGAVLGTSSAGFAQEECRIPQEGTWRLDSGQTMTIGGPGGGPQTGLFEMEVQDCGARLITTGLGSAEVGNVKVFDREGDGYVFNTVYQGFTVEIAFTLIDPELMQGGWTIGGGMATAPGVLSFEAGASQVNLDPRCDCPQFIEQLREVIASNDHFISLYSDPDLANRPSGLDPDQKYTSDIMERLITLRANGDLTTAEAVSQFQGAGSGGSGGSSDSVGTTTGEGSGDVSVTAYTDCDNCQITENQESSDAAGCAGDILRQATLAHEGVHANACAAQTQIANSWNPYDGTEKPPTYCLMTNRPAILAAEEVRAYNASSTYIRSTFSRLCGRPLD